MGFLSDIWEGAKDTASELWENVKEGDIGGILEMGGKYLLTMGTFGLSNRSFVPDTPDVSVSAQDRKVTMRSTVAPQEIVYGRVVKGGTVVYVESSGTHSEYLHLILVLASHRCEGVQNIYFNGSLVAYGGSKTGASQVITPFFLSDGATAAPLEARFIDGSQTAADAAYLYLKLNYSREFYPNGVPDITVELEGHAEVYDPDTELSGYSNNHALCVLDYLTADYGLGVPLSEIDLDSFIDGAAFCAEEADTPPQWVAVPLPDMIILGPGESVTYTLSLDDSEPRFAVDGVIKVTGKPLNALESLVQAGAAYLTFCQGKWRYVRAEYVAPALSLTEDDLIGGVQFSMPSGRGGRFNIAKGRFVDPLGEWEETEYPPVRVQDYIDNDLEELELTLDQPFITSAYRAQRVGKIMLERSRYGLTVRVVAKYKALPLVVGDRVSLTVSALGWSPKIFMVMDIDINLASGVSLTLREDAEAIYTWDYNEQIAITPPPAVTLPDPRPTLPTDLTVTEELYATNPVADFKTRAILEWTGDTDRQTWYDVEYKLSADSDWIVARSDFRGEYATVEDMTPETYDFRVRSMNAIGQYSDWVAETAVVIAGKTAPPPDVGTLYIDNGVLSWGYSNAPIDLAGFEVRAHQGNRSTWADAVVLHAGVVTVSRFDVTDQMFSQRTFLVKAVDTSGNYSTNAATVLLNLGDPVINNVILTHSEAPGWNGYVGDWTVNGSDQLEASQIGGFYNAGSSIFYNQTSTALFYDDEYDRLDYEFEYIVDAADVGAQITLTALVNDADSYRLGYVPPSLPFPGFSGSVGYLEFPGAIRAEEGTYLFRLTIPAQFGGTPPTVDDIIVSLDVEDVTESLEDVAIANTGTRLPITKTYRGIAHVGLTLQTDGSGAVSLKLDDKDPDDGPLVYAYNSAGTAVATTIDAFIRGY